MQRRMKVLIKLSNFKMTTAVVKYFYNGHTHAHIYMYINVYDIYYTI